jgi:hypothetical protein
MLLVLVWDLASESTAATACRRRRKVLQGGHAATLQRTLGKRDCSQNDKMDRGGNCMQMRLQWQERRSQDSATWHGATYCPCLALLGHSITVFLTVFPSVRMLFLVGVRQSLPSHDSMPSQANVAEPSQAGPVGLQYLARPAFIGDQPKWDSRFGPFGFAGAIRSSLLIATHTPTATVLTTVVTTTTHTHTTIPPLVAV